MIIARNLSKWVRKLKSQMTNKNNTISVIFFAFIRIIIKGIKGQAWTNFSIELIIIVSYKNKIPIRR